jgi:HD-GYP domain-containing protein (c-di-GMP phosphodiesterase class II)
MVRISDILKQKGQIPDPEPPGGQGEKPIPPSGEQPAKQEAPEYLEKIEKPTEGIQFSKAIQKEGSEAEKKMQVVSAMHQMQLEPEESRQIYNRALELIREIYNKVESQADPIDLREIYDMVKIMVDRIVLGDRELIAQTINYSEDNYLYAHIVNVCILSIEVGLGLGYNKSKLNELGIDAFLHDLGMIKVMHIANEPRRLNEGEYEEIKKHPIYSNDILSEIKDIQEEVFYITKQVHERLNGKGYPESLKSDQIHEYAKIVAIVDVYEAQTHPRAHRKAQESHEAVKELLNINSAGLFDRTVLKVLINRIGLYPVGSWIELNTGEIGKVVQSYADSPLRPRVNIIFGLDKKRLPRIKSIDLFRHTNIYIKRSINPQESNLKLE